MRHASAWCSCSPTTASNRSRPSCAGSGSAHRSRRGNSGASRARASCARDGSAARCAAPSIASASPRCRSRDIGSWSTDEPCSHADPDEATLSIVPPSARSGARGGLAPIARRLHQAGVSANSVTIAGLLITTAGAALLAYGLPGAALLVLLVGSLADTLDGQIAKAAGGGTKLGAFLDSTFDRLSDGDLAGAALAYAAYQQDVLLLGTSVMALVR